MAVGALAEATVFLGSAVIVVPIFKRLGLGSVLGYLAAGIIIGPHLLGLISDVEEILHFAELGVVFLLFIIGLELQPSRLWSMRNKVFGLGGAQVFITAFLLTIAGHQFGLSIKAAIVAGLALSLSSTAFVLQILAEKNQLSTPQGKSGFGILLFQDLVVIPIMAIMPILGETTGTSAIPAWGQILKVLAVFTLVILINRFLMRRIFRFVASTHSHELFAAMSLLIVIGTALAMQAIGLSMALGAFLAGVLLAESEYRHALEADIEPFKGLLLGLFFIAVGMSADMQLLTTSLDTILFLVFCLLTIKAVVLYALGRLFKHDHSTSLALASILPQGGEFAFVLFGVATGFSAIEEQVANLLILVVTVSMILTPLLVIAGEKLGKRQQTPKRAYDDAPDISEPRVIIAGFGRVGQIVSRILQAKHIPFTALDANPNQVDFVRNFGNKVFYGDATRLDTLRTAGIDKAKVLVVAWDDIEGSIKIIENVKNHYPDIQIYARAYDRLHAYRILELGVDKVERETFRSALSMADGVLRDLGLTYSAAKEAVETFAQHDEKVMREAFHDRQDLNKLQSRAKLAAKELENLFNQEAKEQ